MDHNKFLKRSLEKASHQSWDINNHDRVVNLPRYLERNVLLFTNGTTKFNHSLHSANSTFNLGIKVLFTYSREVKEVY